MEQEVARSTSGPDLKDTSRYIETVKAEFRNHQQIYDEFLKLLSMSKTEQVDFNTIKVRVKSLFQGNRNLILGFNIFLPDSHKIEIPEDSPTLAFCRSPKTNKTPISQERSESVAITCGENERENIPSLCLDPPSPIEVAIERGTKRKHQEDDESKQNSNCVTTTTEYDESSNKNKQNVETHESLLTSNDAEVDSFPEMGFFWLSECPLWVDIDVYDCYVQEWIDVEITQNSHTGGDENMGPNLEDKKDNNKVKVNPEGVHEDEKSWNPINYCFCSSCQARLLRNTNSDESTSRFQLILDEIPFFDGNMKNIKCKEASCKNKSNIQRSDASLLLGMLRFCREVIQIKNCCILPRASNFDSQSKDSTKSLFFGFFDIIVTVTFPHWFISSQPTQTQRRSIIPYCGGKPIAKVLHPATQCLLSMIQSDWNRMDQRKTIALQLKQSTKNHSTTLFPTEMTLDEIYKHMQRGTHNNKHLDHLNNLEALQQDLSSAQQGYEKQEQVRTNRTQEHLHSQEQRTHLQQHRGMTILPQKQQQRQGSSLFLSLPIDVLTTRLVPYLRAKSLHNLRCTSRYLFHSLSAVVPGLSPAIHLYRHQKTSLRWMRNREMRQLTEYDCLTFRNYVSEGNHTIDCYDFGDCHRAVTGGCSVQLAIRKRTSLSKNKINTSMVRLDQLTGREIGLLKNAKDSPAETELSRQQLSRMVARGGLLCDDPGLGKTLTVLSLILQTSGLSTNSSRSTNALLEIKASETSARAHSRNQVTGTAVVATRDAKNGHSRDTNVLFYAYWNEQVVREFRIPSLLKLLNDLGKSDKNRQLSYSLARLKTMVHYEDFGRDFKFFQEKVENEIMLNSPTDDFLLKTFRSIVGQFKSKELRSAKKSVLNSKTVSDSVVAELIHRENRQRLMDSLESSSGSLLVIPSVLMEHWQAQIEQHVDLRYLSKQGRIPLVFNYGKKDTGMTVDRVLLLCKVEQTHDPIIFLDKSGTRPLPSPKFLAMFRIVITTTQRFTNEWKKGSFQKELERRDKKSECNLKEDNDWICTISENEEDSELVACPLLKVHWLRIIVDEGHSMGNGKTNSAIQFASWIQADRRWAMTGTPTKQTDVQITQILNLLNFLKHGFFTTRHDGDNWWKRHIAKNWREGDTVSFFRLRSLLGFLIQRHTKKDIVELVPPHYTDTKISMSFNEVTTYNTLVNAVQSNIFITSLDGKTSGLQDSLLHRSQVKNARLALANIRRVCVGFAHVVPTLSEENKRATLEYATERNKLTQNAVNEIRNFLSRSENEMLSQCCICTIRLPVLLLLPCCGALVCAECMTGSSLSCLRCESHFDVDEFQKFQPGFNYNWKSNLAWSSKSGSLTADPGPIIRPQQDRRRVKRSRGDHVCEYDFHFSDGNCIVCHEEHASCNFLNDEGRCKVCYKFSEDCPEEESKAAYLVKKLLHLNKVPRMSRCKFGEPCSKKEARPLKVIVFSQFRATLDVIGDRLLRKFGSACIAEYFGMHRTHELRRFVHEEDCFCLLLTKDGSEGLDLSFVTNIVFLEEIYDKSLQDQAVARAWRMGASGRVEVETLIADDTVEVEMRRLNNFSISSMPGSDTGPAICDRQRIKSLLLSLRLIANYHQFGQCDFVKENSHAVRQSTSPYDKSDERIMKGSAEASNNSVTDEQQIRPTCHRVHFNLLTEL